MSKFNDNYKIGQELSNGYIVAYVDEKTKQGFAVLSSRSTTWDQHMMNENSESIISIAQCKLIYKNFNKLGKIADCVAYWTKDRVNDDYAYYYAFSRNEAVDNRITGFGNTLYVWNFTYE